MDWATKLCVWANDHIARPSHSSVERVILPDSTILTDYLLEKTTKLVDQLVVYPARMRRNLDLTRGLVFSGQVLLDLAADLLVPPLTYVALAMILGLTASVLWVLLGGGGHRDRDWWVAAPWAAAAAGFALYVVRGVWLSRVGPRAILDLAWAPVYMAWKVVLALRYSASREREWVRTAREGEKP